MVGRAKASAGAPQRRLVLLGASNVCNGLSVIVETARRLFSQPLEVFAALGHGRSYGREHWVLLRGLPGILQCGLWDALEAAPAAQTSALITDIGNDLLYDVSPAQIASWVRTCIKRLQPRAERLAIAALPVDNLRDLSNSWYLLLRTFLFPRSRIDRATVVSRAEELNERIAELARALQAPVVQPQPSWYGFDPIHLRPAMWPEAWRAILAPLAESDAPPSGGSWLEWLYCQGLWPLEWKLVTRPMHVRQPAGRLSDGTTIALY